MYGTENLRYPSKYELMEYIKDEIGYKVCLSSIEKDMKMLRDDFGIHIKYSKYLTGYFIEDPPTREEFKDQILIYLNIEL